ncbi:MAG TPA: DUF21 domain-containing protein, partial [Rhodothermales bacterium]
MDPDPASTGHFLLLLLQDSGIVLTPAVLLLQVALLIFLFLASAFFSGSEVALYSMEAGSANDLDEPQDAAEARVRRLLEHPRQLLASLLILNTFAKVAAAMVAAFLVADMAAVLGWNVGWTVVAEVIVLTFVLLVGSE